MIHTVVSYFNNGKLRESVKSFKDDTHMDNYVSYMERKKGLKVYITKI
jgi:hypothetical protein